MSNQCCCQERRQMLQGHAAVGDKTMVDVADPVFVHFLKLGRAKHVKALAVIVHHFAGHVEVAQYLQKVGTELVLFFDRRMNDRAP